MKQVRPLFLLQQGRDIVKGCFRARAWWWCVWSTAWGAALRTMGNNDTDIYYKGNLLWPLTKRSCGIVDKTLIWELKGLSVNSYSAFNLLDNLKQYFSESLSQSCKPDLALASFSPAHMASKMSLFSTVPTTPCCLRHNMLHTCISPAWPL